MTQTVRLQHFAGRAARSRRPTLIRAIPILLIIVVTVVAVTTVMRPARTPGQSEGLPLDGRWKLVSPSAQVYALFEDPWNPGELLAGTTDGVWRSDDAGGRWQRVWTTTKGGVVFAFSAIAGGGPIVAAHSDGAVYASTGRAFSTWWRISPPLDGGSVFAVAASPHHNRTILAGTSSAIYRGRQQAGVWRWTRVARTASSAITSIVWAPWDDRLVFASVFGTAPAVLSSHDGGVTWQRNTAGLPGPLPSEFFLVGDVHAHQIYLSTMGAGVWLRSTGGVWRDVSAGLPQRHAMPLADSPKDHHVLYAGTMGFGVYEKRGNDSWRLLGHGLNTPNDVVLSLMIPSVSHPALFAGTSVGIFRYLPAS